MMIWTLERLIKHSNSTQAEINGRWVPARPLPYMGIWGFKLNVRAAWMILTGKADAFLWPEGQ